jgi:hypothetical protein
MPKPLRASIIATVSIQMIVTDEDKLTDGVETLEDGIKYALGDELYRIGSPFEFSIETESVDGIEILDYGDFAELEQCPLCGTLFALKSQVELIQHKGSCQYCPDPEQEELE